MEIKSKDIIIIIGLIIVLLVSSLLALAFGSIKIDFMNIISRDLRSVEETIIYKIRLPRLLVAGGVGLALAVAGVIFQGLFKNVMADPYIIGISSGASLGAVIAITCGLNFYWYGISGITCLSFLGALISLLFVYQFAKINGKVPIQTLLLAGVAISFLLSALVSLLMILDSNSLQKVFYWLMGSLAGASWLDVKLIYPGIIIGFIIVYFFSQELNILLLGEESAYYLGVEVETIKLILLVVATLLTSLAVSISGVIGFIGLIIPHSLRLVVGANHKVLLPVAALGGASFLIIADTISRILLAPTEIPVGIVTALCGAPFFLYLLREKKINF